MLKHFVVATAIFATPALAQEGLNFDPAQVCSWQAANNSMDIGECTQLENEAKASVAELEATVDGERKSACVAEAKNFSSDAGFASYTIYAGCLKDGPGSL